MLLNSLPSEAIAVVCSHCLAKETQVRLDKYGYKGNLSLQCILQRYPQDLTWIPFVTNSLIMYNWDLPWYKYYKDLENYTKCPWYNLEDRRIRPRGDLANLEFHFIKLKSYQQSAQLHIARIRKLKSAWLV